MGRKMILFFHLFVVQSPSFTIMNFSVTTDWRENLRLGFFLGLGFTAASQFIYFSRDLFEVSGTYVKKSLTNWINLRGYYRNSLLPINPKNENVLLLFYGRVNVPPLQAYINYKTSSVYTVSNNCKNNPQI